MVWYSHLFKNFPQFVVIHTVKGFSVVSEADTFLEFPCFLHDPTNYGNVISGSSFLNPACTHICKFSVHIPLKPTLKDFEHYLDSMWNECICTAVWTFFGIAFLWDWNENWPFPGLWPLLRFPNLLPYWVQHFHRVHLTEYLKNYGRRCHNLYSRKKTHHIGWMSAAVDQMWEIKCSK